MKIAVANDHRGVKAIEEVKAIIAQLGHECLDLSHKSEQPIDYPDAAYRAAILVSNGQGLTGRRFWSRMARPIGRF